MTTTMHYTVIHRRFSTSTISSAPSKLVVPHSLCSAVSSKRLRTFMMTALQREWGTTNFDGADEIVEVENLR